MTNKQNTRIEHDGMGAIEVPSDKYWGAQTQRSLLHFKPTNEIFPKSLIDGLLVVKISAAKTNSKLNALSKEIADAIVKAGNEALDNKLDGNFPLSVWQTGSGTQTNMNVNEVLSNRAIEILGGVMGSKNPVHPNDHVNLGQSSNDSFPTAMNIATVVATNEKLLPTLNKLISLLEKKQNEYKDIIKIGRTHLQDATPITLGQEFSGYATQVKKARDRILVALEEVYYLAQGGTAVGTGLNCPKGFVDVFINEVCEITKLPFKSAPNKFYSLASHDDLVNFSGALNSLSVAITKIANDIRLLGCGPRAGLAELILPENEPGSSIMPGKVNPTQIEALTMVCVQVMASHKAVSLGGMQGHLELNVYKPVIIYNILNSINILDIAITGFNNYCLEGLKADTIVMEKLMSQSLMLVTSLTKHIGYDKAAEIAKLSHKEGTTLKESALKLKYCSAEDFDKWVNPKNMI
jgi:fumarate hydratase class II